MFDFRCVSTDAVCARLLMNWCLCITLHPLSPERALQPSPGQSAAPPWDIWFDVIGKKAAIELVGDGLGNRVNDRHCTVDVDRLGTGSSSLSPFASDMGE